MRGKGRSRPERRRYDGRSQEARRVRVLFRGYVARLSDPTDPLLVLAARRAAELVAVAERLRAQAIRGEPTDFSDLIKIENAGRRAVRELHLKTIEEKRELSLSDYLANKTFDSDTAPNGAAKEQKEQRDQDAAAPNGAPDIAAATKQSDEAAA